MTSVSVIPAKAVIQKSSTRTVALDPRFREGDEQAQGAVRR
jgi:hypothetical protein